LTASACHAIAKASIRSVFARMPERAGEGPCLTPTDHRHGHPGGGNDLENPGLEAARCLQDDERVSALGQARCRSTLLKNR
jgi:hypothetical protein